MKKYLTFDDIQIVPNYSNIISREDVTLNTRFTKNTELTVPIVAAPMDTICELKMAKEIEGKYNFLDNAKIVENLLEFDDEKTLGINKKITKGLLTPPVK